MKQKRKPCAHGTHASSSLLAMSASCAAPVRRRRWVCGQRCAVGGCSLLRQARRPASSRRAAACTSVDVAAACECEPAIAALLPAAAPHLPSAARSRRRRRQSRRRRQRACAARCPPAALPAAPVSWSPPALKVKLREGDCGRVEAEATTVELAALEEAAPRMSGWKSTKMHPQVQRAAACST